MTWLARTAVFAAFLILSGGLAPPFAAAAAPEKAADYNIVMVGGTGAIPESVADDMRAYTSGTVTRLGGPNRFATAATVSIERHSPGVPVAYIATGEAFPDALAVGPEAALGGGPLLLVGKNAVPAESRAELQRLRPQRLVVVGGAAAVSASVEAELNQIIGRPIERVAGRDRFATAAALSAARYEPGVPYVFVASGQDFPDALVGGAAAAVSGGPLLLTARDSLPSATATELARLAPKNIVILGGRAAVSSALLDSLIPYTTGKLTRLSGSNRFATAAAVAEWVYPNGVHHVYLTTGGNFPDALAITPEAGSQLTGDAAVRGPILLMSGGTTPAETAAELDRLARVGQKPPPPPNKAPTATAGTLSVVEDESAPLTLAASDPEGDPLTYDITKQPAHGTLSGTPPNLSYTPDPGFTGTDVVRFDASDGTSTSSAATVTITVVPRSFAVTRAVVASAPMAAGSACPSAQTTAVAGSTVTIVVCGHNRTGATLTPSVAASSLGGTLAGAAGTFSSGPVPAGSTERVLANWSGTTVTATPGANRTAITRVGPSSGPASPMTSLDGFLVTTALPTNITLSNAASVAENRPSGTTVGTFSATDPDIGEGHTFKLVPGAGSTHNAAFTIVGATLRSTATFDHETQPTRSVRVRTTDASGAWLEKAMTVTVLDVNEAPSALTLSSTSVAENLPINTAVGTFGTTDPDAGDTHTFALVSGAGDTGNQAFTIIGSTLRTALALDHETTPSYAIRIRVTDADGLSMDRQLTITVADVNEAPVVVDQSFTAAEGAAVGTPVGTMAFTDPDGDQDHAFSFPVGVAGVADLPFAINATSGVITVAGPLDPDESPLGLTVLVTDDGNPVLHGDGIATITIIPLNDPPVATDQGPVTTAEDTSVDITLTGTDPEGDALTFAIDDDPEHGSLGPIGTPDCSTTPGTCTATVTYTPDEDHNGADAFTFTVADPTSTSPAAEVTLSVTPVDDAPVVTASSGTTSYTEDGAPLVIDADVTVEDVDSILLTEASAQIEVGCDSDQDVLALSGTHDVTASYDPVTCALVISSLETVADMQAALRSVTYRNTSDNPDTASRTVRFAASDATSDSSEDDADKSLSVTAVNDAPVLAAIEGTAAVFTEKTPATPISSTITVTDVDSTTLASATVAITGNFRAGQDVLALPTQPSITASWNGGTGTLSLQGSASAAAYQDALRAVTYSNSSADPATVARTITFQVSDTATPNTLSNLATRGLSVVAVNDAPVATTHTYAAQANMAVTIPAGSGLLAGATDAEQGTTLTVGVTGATTPAGGSVSGVNQATGAFTFNPPPGYTGAVTFTYTVCDDGAPAPGICSTPATVTVNVSGPVVWFVDDDAAAGGNGSLTAPFQTLPQATTAAGSSVNHRIFLHSGTYGSGAVLNPGGHLIGQSVTGTNFDTVMGLTPPAGTAPRPAIGGSSVTLQGTVTLATDSRVRGVAIVSGAAPALLGAQAYNVLVDQTSASTTTGTALSLADVSGPITLNPLTKAGAGTAIALTNVASVVTIPTGSITGTTTNSISINGGNGNFSFGGTVVNTVGRAVWVRNRVAGSRVTLGGAVTSTGGDGVLLTANTSAFIFFNGGLNLTTGAQPAFTATGGGIVTVTGAGNRLNTTGATALRIENTNIGDGSLRFERIDASGASSGIVLNTTGLGTLQVTGTPGVVGSGGTITGSTSHGISLRNTRNVSLAWMTITESGGSGINAEQLLGPNNYLSSLQVSRSALHNVAVHNSAGTGSVSISGQSCDLRNLQDTVDSQNHVLFDVTGDTYLKGSIDGCRLQGSRTAAVRADASGDLAWLDLVLTNSTIVAGVAPHPRGTSGVDVTASGQARITTDIHDLDIGTDGTTSQPLSGTGINVFAGNSSSVSTKVKDNVIENDPLLFGSGIRMLQDNLSKLNARVEGNTISGIGWDYGIYIDASTPVDAPEPGPGDAMVNIAVLNNTTTVGDAALNPIRLQVRRLSAMCARVAGNTTSQGGIIDPGPERYEGLYARQANGAVFQLEGLATGPQDAVAGQAWLTAQNPLAQLTGAAGTFTGVAANSCPLIPAA